MAVKLNQSEKDLIKDRRFMRRVAHGYEMQIAPGVWLKGAFLAQGQDRFIVDADRLRAGIGAALASLDSQDNANFAAAALLRLKTAGVDLGDARLREALAGSPYALTLLAALDADVSDFDGVRWGQGGVVGAPAGTDAAFLLGSGGADRLTGTAGDDTLAGNGGDDRLAGGAGNDTYLFSAGDGRDTIDESFVGAGSAGDRDTIRFGAGITPAMISFQRVGQDLVLRFEGSDDRISIAGWGRGQANQIERFEFADGTVWDAGDLAEFVRMAAPVGTDGDDVLQGWDDVGDVLRGGAGDDVLSGAGGDDALFGGAGNDILDGGTGNDELSGSLGADVYLFQRGDGQDTIYDLGRDRNGVDPGTDTIRFGVGISADDIVLRRENDGLVLAIAGTDDRITVRGWGWGEVYRIERVEFADGTLWQAADLQQRIAGLPLSSTAGDGDDQVVGWDGFDETLQGLGGDDFLNGGNGNDILEGGTGNDELWGGEGSDTYRFARGDGMDTILDGSYDGSENTLAFGPGIAESDIVMARSGNDLVIRIKDSSDQVTIWGMGGNASSGVQRVVFADGTIWDASRLEAMVAALDIVGTDGNDYLYGDGGDNILIGGAGDDVLNGMAGNDTYVFERGDGQDSIDDSGYGNDTIRFGAGIDAGDVSVARAGNDLVLVVAGGDDRVSVRNWGYGDYYRIEQVSFADGTVWDAAHLAALYAAAPVLGTDGDDILVGDEGANVLDGGAGNDTLQGRGGSDTYLFERGDGQDVIEEGGYERDMIRFGAGIGAADIVLSRVGSDLVLGLAGSSDRVTVRNWAYGDYYRIEQVAFADGTVWDAQALASMIAAIPVSGTDGDDVLTGDAGDNTLDGGAGNDTLYGADGNDTYVFRRGGGQDNIAEFGGGMDTIRFGDGIGAGDIALSRSGNDLVFALAGSDDRVTVRNWAYGDYYRIEQVAFADGTVWDAQELAARVSAIPVVGTDLDDVLTGDAGANILIGGAGNDNLRGLDGGDTYVFGRGDGQDSIEEYGSGLDTIRFGAGIAAADIKLSRSGNDFVFGIAGTADSVTVRYWAYGEQNRIEQVVFEDGTVWDAAQLAAMFAAAPLRGTDGDDVLYGDSGANVIDGGAGNDVLNGGSGGDTYQFERGDGHDTIFDWDWYSAGADSIRFGAGIAAADVTLRRSGADIVFEIAGGDSITVQGWKNGEEYRIELVAFADGTVWDSARLAALVAAIPVLGTDGDDVLNGDDDANLFVGGAGNDTLLGNGGDDTYLFERGDGQDIIEEGGNDLNDTIRFGAGITAADITLSRSGSDLVLSLAGGDDRITVRNWADSDWYRIERVAFADGTMWDAAMLAEMAAAVPFVGTDGDDVVDGDDGANVLDGKAGNDVLRGGYGGDTYLFERGDGQDSIDEEGYDLDTIRFGAGIAAADVTLTRSGNDIVFSLAGSDDRVTVRNWREGQHYQIEQVVFADGTVWDAAALAAMVTALPFSGTDGDDVLYGDSGANVFDGGAGDDVLNGLDGGDTYLFERGDGRDHIIEEGYGIDTIRFGAGIRAEDIELSRSDSALVFGLAGSDDSITVRDWAYGDWYRIEQVRFADGTTWDATALAAMVAAIPALGTDGDDDLSGDAGPNTFVGGAGDDILRGGGGDDTYLFERGDGQDTIDEGGYGDLDTIRFGAGILAADVRVARKGADLVFTLDGSDDRITVRSWQYGEYYRVEQVAFADGTVWDAAAIAERAAVPYVGTDGDDVLDGDDGANVLVGGAGNDILRGGSGSDIYLFERGDGQDTIVESGYEADTIRFGAGIAPADVVVKRNGLDLVLALPGTGDQVTVRNWAWSDWCHIEQVAFADGTTWDAAALAGMFAAAPLVGTVGDDNLIGDAMDNVLVGGAGNDLLQGGEGNDTYVFERGDGRDTIYEYGYGSDTIRFGAGIAAADITVARDSGRLVFSLAGTDDSITVADWQYGSYYRIEQVLFADGTSWDAATLDALANVPLVGTDGDDILFGDADDNVFDGGAGNDLLLGGQGADTYLFERGDGQDSIHEEGDDTDTLRFGAGIGSDDIVLSREGGSLVFTVAGSGDRVAVASWSDGAHGRIERVEFADGSAWDAEQIAAMAAKVPILGTDWDDYLFGDEQDNILAGAAGNDLLRGGQGADTYLFERGDGQDSISEEGDDTDTIRFGAGIGPDDIVLSREGGSLVFTLAGSGDRVAVASWSDGAYGRIERVEFADGSAWDAEQIAAMAAGLPIVGTDWDDYLFGDEQDNVLAGGAGNDWLQGGTGGDTYLFGRGDGLDVVYDEGNDPGRPDVIRFGEGISEADVVVNRIGNDLAFSLDGTDDRIYVQDWQYGEPFRVERVEFADGSAWDAAAIEARIVPLRIVGSDSSDYMRGDEHANVLVGGGGDDTMIGDAGDDLYLFEAGDGRDHILDYDYREGNIDTIRFGAGIEAGDVLVSRRDGNLVLTVGATGQSVTVIGAGDDASYAVERVEFADGTAWSGDDLMERVAEQPVTGGAGHDVLSGWAGAEGSMARAAIPGTSEWALSSSLLAFSLHAGSEAVLGGEPGVRFGAGGELSVYPADSAQALLASPEIGKPRQPV